jgi:hypothetical protein
MTALPMPEREPFAAHVMPAVRACRRADVSAAAPQSPSSGH